MRVKPDPGASDDSGVGKETAERRVDNGAIDNNVRLDERYQPAALSVQYFCLRRKHMRSDARIPCHCAELPKGAIVGVGIPWASRYWRRRDHISLGKIRYMVNVIHGAGRNRP